VTSPAQQELRYFDPHACKLRKSLDDFLLKFPWPVFVEHREIKKVLYDTAVECVEADLDSDAIIARMSEVVSRLATSLSEVYRENIIVYASAATILCRERVYLQSPE